MKIQTLSTGIIIQPSSFSTEVEIAALANNTWLTLTLLASLTQLHLVHEIVVPISRLPQRIR